MNVRTSQSHPLGLSEVEPLKTRWPGTLSLTFCPGKHDWSLTGGHRWERHLGSDIAAMALLGVDGVVSLLGDREHHQLCVPDLYEQYETAGFRVWRIATADGHPPDPSQLAGWVAPEHSRLAFW